MSTAVHNEMAQFAYQHVQKAVKSPANSSEFRTLARSFPSMLQASGLGAAIAFLYAKGKFPHKALYQLIDTWTRNRFCSADTKTELAQRISSLSSQEYRLYTVEVMNLCLWVKRFAEGMVEADGENQSS